MKHLSFKEIQCRLMAILMLVVCGFTTAHALESDDINTAILEEGSVPPTWTNDPDHPWYIVQNSDGSSYIRTPETAEDSKFTSTLSFTYKSSYPTEVRFSGCRNYDYYSRNDSLVVKIDGEVITRHQGDWKFFKFMVPSGNHSIELISISTKEGNGSYFTGIRNLKVLECKELETACLKEGSMPITFENDPDNMWITDNGYIRSQPIKGGTPSKISTTFTIDKASLFSYEISDDCYYSGRGYYKTNVSIDGTIYDYYASKDWVYGSVVLYPGTHTIEFENWQDQNHSENDLTYIRNVCLDQTWYEAVIDKPGNLGTRLNQALGGKNFQDVELLKIKGTMNSEDWNTVGMLSGIKAIDFTEADITEIPDEAMDYLKSLSTVMLPNTVTRIGDKAFYNCSNFHQINIPASVESIGREVWRDTPLQFITFEQNSKLAKIGYCAFYKTKIMEFKMPDSVTEIGRDGSYGLFAQCTSLRKLHLSENLSTVPAFICNNCSSIEEVNIPSNATAIEEYAFAGSNIKNLVLPSTLTTIGNYAFYESALESLHLPSSVHTFGYRFAESCRGLKEVTLSSHCWDMDNYFSGCGAIRKIVVPCATPPTIKNDPFPNVGSATVDLIVPDFAFDAYKIDSYWHYYTSARATDEASVRDFWSIRGDLTLDGNHVMRGNPSVRIETIGKLVMDADAVQSFDTFEYNSPGSYLSNSNNVTANKLEARYLVSEANKWFFFAPVTDVKMSDIWYPATDSWVIRYYDGARRASENSASGNWVNVPADGTLKRGQGYIIQARVAGWLFMPAATTEHDKFFGSNEVTLPLDDNACETAANAGWNFVANPYPSYYDIYYIGMQAPITVWTGSTYRAHSLNDGDRGDDTFVLYPMQPFFVQKSTPDLTTVMPLTGRRTSTVIDRSAPLLTTVDPNRHKLNLELFSAEKEEADDYTRIVLNENADEAYETNCDASKFMSLDNNVAQIYSLGEKQHPMAINERPYVDGNVALGVYLPVSGERYMIAARRADRKAWIYDAVTGIEHDLTSGDYFFTATKAGIDNSRFTIRFAPTTVIEDVDATVVKVSGHRGYIEVNAPEGSDIAVYATDGTSVANVKAENGLTEIPATAGIYIVKVNGKSVKTIVK